MNDETLVFNKSPPLIAHMYDLRQGQFMGMSFIHCLPNNRRILDADRFDGATPVAKYSATISRPKRPESLEGIRLAYDAFSDHWDKYGNSSIRQFCDAGATLLKYVHRQPCWAGTWMALTNCIDRQFAEYRDTIAQPTKQYHA